MLFSHIIPDCYIAFLILVRYTEIGAEAVRRFVGVPHESKKRYNLIITG